jgi:glycosyltransferase involved in cell wall biosynthesis
MGIPAVSTRVGGVPELLQEGVAGFLAPVGDAEGLARQVAQLIEDGELRQSCARACRARIEQDFSFARRVRRMEEYYDLFGARP